MHLRHRIPALVTALSLLSAGFAVAQQTGTANLERVEVAGRKAEVSKWFRAESQHFVVYSDTREEDVSALLDNLEKLDHLMRIYTLPISQAEQPEPKLTLYYHNRLSDLREVDDGVPADAVGLYSSCSSGVQGFGVHIERIARLSDDQLEKSPLDETLSYAFEAYARHFLYRRTDIRVPMSFIDGFAQYFSSVRFSEQQMVVGRTPPALANYLRFIGDGRRYSLEYEDVLAQRLSGARNFAGDAGVRLEYEAKAWLLVHYMLATEERRQRLNRYLALVGAGQAPTAAFESAFGVKGADISELMWRYGLKGTQVLRVAHPSLPATRVKFRSLPRTAGEFVLVDAALKSCPGRPAGEALLKKVTALAANAPDDSQARLTLSRAQIDWGDPREAMPRLQALVHDEESNFEAWYLLGRAELRLAEISQGQARIALLQEARRHLQRARGLRPQSPDAAFAAFQVELATTDVPDPAALDGAIAAWEAARDVDALGRTAALTYAYAGRADEAYQALGALAQGPGDAPTVRWARQWRERLQAGVTRGTILAELRNSPAPEVASRAWTIDKQSVMRKVERGYGLEAADSFIKEQQRQQNQATQPAGNLDSGMVRK